MTKDARFRLLAAGYLALLAATWPLWTPQTAFPQVALISAANQTPQFVEWILLGVLVMSLGILLVVQNTLIQRWTGLVVVVSTWGLIGIDQHRLQPWVWQFVLVSAVLSTSQSRMALTAWRWLVIGIYAWSAWSKMDHDFCLYHGPFLLDGFCTAIGLSNGTRFGPDSVRFGLAAAIPAFELLVAIGLCWRRTRIAAVIGAAMMHVGLLLALGPLGHGHRSGVLIWNAFFLVQNWWLFGRDPEHSNTGPGDESTGLSNTARLGNLISGCIVAGAMMWPLLEPFGLCDHWPAWAVYAAKPERVTVLIEADEIADLPENLRQYVGGPPTPGGWVSFRIDRWSLDTVFAPIYPQDRFQIGVALGLARKYQLDQMQIVVESPANRWTGQRTVRHFVGLEAIGRFVDTYRCNGHPRSTLPQARDATSSAAK